MNTNGRIHLKVQTEKVVVSGISDPGLVRSENQDSIHLDESGDFMLLADGMGGHERGSEASQTVLQVMQEYFHPEVLSAELMEVEITEGSGIPPAVVCLLSLVDEAVSKANSVLYERNQQAKLQRYMGTTIVGMIFMEREYVLWFHVGDSRLYRLRDSNLKCLTTDHSAYNEWVRKGRNGEKPGKNVVTRAIGPNPGVSADASWDKWNKNDTYVLCCDGLTDMVADEKIAEILAGSTDVDDIASRLINAANEAGGKDNVSVVVCRVH